MAVHNFTVRRIEMLTPGSLGSHLVLPTLIRTQGAQPKANSETSEAKRA